MTEAARDADVVLPTAGMAEKEGTLTSSERRVQKVRRAVKGAGKSKADWEIFVRLAAAMGVSGLDFSSVKDILREISEVVPYYSGLADVCLGNGGIQWPFTSKDAAALSEGQKAGTARLLDSGIPKEKRVFSAVPAWNTGEDESRYPLSLVLGELLFHSGSLSRYSGNLNKVVSTPCLLVNPATAAQYKIPDESMVKIFSANGSLAVPARYSEDMVPGVVFLPRHFADARASDLMVPGPGTESMTSIVKVRIERAEE